MITGALLVAMALLVAAGSVALALSHHRRVAAPFAGEELDRAALLRVPMERRLDVAAQRALPGGWTRALVDAVREAPDDAARIAATNEALGDLALQLEAGAGWAPAALRVGISATLLLAVAAFLVGVPYAALPVCAVGGAGALGAADAGRRARALAARQRERADEIVALLLPDLVRQAGASQGRRRRRA